MKAWEILDELISTSKEITNLYYDSMGSDNLYTLRHNEEKRKELFKSMQEMVLSPQDKSIIQGTLKALLRAIK